MTVSSRVVDYGTDDEAVRSAVFLSSDTRTYVVVRCFQTRKK